VYAIFLDHIQKIQLQAKQSYSYSIQKLLFLPNILCPSENHIGLLNILGSTEKYIIGLLNIIGPSKNYFGLLNILIQLKNIFAFSIFFD
jgi:hypothetical protein